MYYSLSLEVTHFPKCFLSNKVCLYNVLSPKLPDSGDNNVPLPPGTWRVHFSWEIYLLFPGEEG